MPSTIKKKLITLGWAVASLILVFLITYVENKEKALTDNSGQLSNNVSKFEYDQYDNQVVTITRVVDGDTLYVSNKKIGEEKVRLIGINAPEIQHPTKGKECFGDEAHIFAQKTYLGQEATLTIDKSQDLRDRHERLLGYISIDSNDIGHELIRRGYAREYTYRSSYQNQERYRDAEDNAQQLNFGLWSCSE